MACAVRSGLQLGVSAVMPHHRLMPCKATNRSISRSVLVPQCAKGFSKKKAAPKKAAGKKQSDNKQASKPKQTATTVKQPAVEEAPRPARRQLPVAPNPSPDTNRPGPAISLPSSMPDLVDSFIELDDKDFADRLAALKAAGKQKAKEKAVQANPEVQAMGNILEAEPSIYSNPPPLSETILKEMNSGISDPSMQTQTFGPSQIGIAAGAIALVGVLVFTSVGGFSNTSRYKGVKPSKPPPNEIQATILSNQVESSKEALRENPKDEAALEALGYAYSDLYDFANASDTFEKLVQLPNRRNDLTAWKLFGESSLLAERPKKAVQGFETAWDLQSNDFNTLTNLTNAYIANGDFSKAADKLKGVQEGLRSQPETATAASASATAPTTDAAPAAALAEEASGSAVSQPEASGPETVPTADVAAAEAKSDVQAGTVTESAGVESERGLQDAAEVAEAIATTSRDAGSSESSSSSGSQEGALSQAPATLNAPPVEASSTSEATTSEVPQSQLRSVVSRKAKSLDPIGVDLLLAKVYSAWRGHDLDATATYDALIKAYPEDFRGYLAKGVFLRDRGRGVEAKKMFLQARYYTPAAQQGLIDRISKSEDLKTGS